jgi:hypothetical protein
VVAAGYCSATGFYRPRMVILEDTMIIEPNKQNLLTGPSMQMTDFCYISDTVFLK